MARVLSFLCLTLAVAPFASAQVSTSTIYPASATVNPGTWATQPISVLSVKDLSGVEDIWAKYWELTTAGGSFSGIFTFPAFPSTIGTYTTNLAELTDIEVDTNYRGPEKLYQNWSFYLKNHRTGAWDLIGDNGSAGDWVWKMLGPWRTMTLGLVATDYVSSTQPVQVKVTANNAFDVCTLNYIYVKGTFTAAVGGVNECADPALNNCDLNASCQDLPTGFSCTCNAGYTGNGVVCTDIDECTATPPAHNCHADATCTNTPGSFSCACKSGYQGDGVTCADIDECATTPGICGTQQCTNAPPGTYTCGQPPLVPPFGEKVYPSGATASTGTLSTQAIQVLHVKDQKDAEDDWLKYKELTTAAAAPFFEAVFTMQDVPSPIAAGMYVPNMADLVSIEFGMNYRGQAKQFQIWSCYARNHVLNTWDLLGDNDGAADWVWKMFTWDTTTLGLTPSHYLTATQPIQLKVVANNAFDVCQIEYMYAKPMFFPNGLNECADPATNDCDPNASCTDLPQGFSCACNQGYTGDGKTCVNVNECTSGGHNCHANAVCTDTTGSWTCACAAGFIGDGVATCTDVDECAAGTHNCDGNAVCGNTIGSFTCTCNSGYAGTGQVCTDVDECASPTLNDCHADAICTNLPGAYGCACKPGFTGDGQTCTDIDECQQPGICSGSPCYNAPGTYSCGCPPGHQGGPGGCQDIDECAAGTHNCDANAACTNNVGSFSCACNPGFSGNGQVCNDIDECASSSTNNCHGSATCTNTPGSYSCACQPGYEGNGQLCQDINECSDPSLNNCHADANCFNAAGSYVCICKQGFAGDGFNCGPYTPPPIKSFFAAGPTTIVDIVGTHSYPDPFTALSVKDQTGTQDEYEKYIEFTGITTPAQGYNGYVTFDLTPSILPANVTSIDIVLSARCAEMIFQMWQFSIYNFQQSQWILVGDNTAQVNWAWTVYSVRLAEITNFSHFMDPVTNKIHIGVSSPTAADVFNLDYVGLNCTMNELPLGPPAPPPNPNPNPHPAPSPPAAPTVSTTNAPLWAYNARVGGLSMQHTTPPAQVAAMLDQRKSEGVSVIELDSRLSNFITDDEFFNVEIPYLTMVASECHARQMDVVIYWPSLEVLTLDGVTNPNSFAKLHPTWIQKGLDGTANVFYGNKEHWVPVTAESAWADPESESFLNDYLFPRARAVAATGMDGIWWDVPLYFDTGAAWAGGSIHSAAAFAQWSMDMGMASAPGYSLPTGTQIGNHNDPVFRAWLRWRHHSIARFTDRLRQETMAVNPDILTIVENFPADYMDGSWTGFDGNYRDSEDHYMRVWEIDSVSNDMAMKWSSMEDFANKITMFKFTRGADRDQPTWSFSYGNEELDAGLTMGAAIATRNAPFECKTPQMTQTVGSSFRQTWFNFVGDNVGALLTSDRLAYAGVMYSSPTRDFYDMQNGGMYAMYLETTAPTTDPTWWGRAATDSLVNAKHVAAYRGASYALSMLHVPYKIVNDPGNPTAALAELKFLWLPNVVCMSDATAAAIRAWVQNGGALLASGLMPGMETEMGEPRSQSVLADVFGLGTGAWPRHTHAFGSGVAIFRPDLDGRLAFEYLSSKAVADGFMKEVQLLARIHVPEDIIVYEPKKGLHVELSPPASDHQHIYLVNYNGLAQRPISSAPVTTIFHYRAPPGKRVTVVGAYTPNSVPAWAGELNFNPFGKEWYGIELVMDQFTLVTVFLEDLIDNTPAYTGPSWPNPTWQAVAEESMTFVKTQMRYGAAKPDPYGYGIFTNMKDDQSIVEIYAHGHHVTSEHMGLMLRATACMNDRTAYDETYRFVTKMRSPHFNVINWAMDKASGLEKPLIQNFNPVGGANWVSANAPLDDLRAIRGLLAGPEQGGVDAALDLAERALRGLYWTTVTDRMAWGSITSSVYPAYPMGLLGFAFDWEETEDPTLTPPATATALGVLGTDLIPVDYQDLWTLEAAAKVYPRFAGVVADATAMMLDSEIPAVPGLFYNGLKPDGTWTGDFENQGLTQGKHLKTIQVLWIALHLARASAFDDQILSPVVAADAGAAAFRTLSFFKTFYQANGRIPEYLTMAGLDVPNCPATDCLVTGNENLINGEARIYAQVARLAHLLNDSAFAAQLIDEKIITDRVTTPGTTYGNIGASTTAADNAEAWNNLESVLTMCVVAGGK